MRVRARERIVGTATGPSLRPAEREEGAMTTTSMLGTGPVSIVGAWWRFAAAILVIAALGVGAFAMGRATATTATRPASPPVHVIRPGTPAAATPTPAPYLCRIGRPC
jgi:hypothetical protein